MVHHENEYYDLLLPETPLESFLIGTPEFQVGLDWGLPRFGHPEGKVGLHVRDVLDNVDGIAADPQTRQRLRLVALSHDTFKYKEFHLGRRIKHHGLLAREFMENLVDDPLLLDVVELHDEAFYAWRHAKLEADLVKANQRLDKIASRIGEDIGFFYSFFKCDTQTGDKVQAPLYWFEGVLANWGVPV